MLPFSQVLKLYTNPFFKTLGYVRFVIAPFEEIFPYLPDKGIVWDLGCGYGFLANYLALGRPQNKIFGLDNDQGRIAKAQETILERQNIQFLVNDLSNPETIEPRPSCIICFDLLHHLPKGKQGLLLEACQRMLLPKGVLLLKEINKKPAHKYLWNYCHDKITTGGKPLFFRSSLEWQTLLQNLGFTIKEVRFLKKGFLYPHVLLVAVKE